MKYVLAALLALAAIAIPNLHTAMQRSKQKYTMADIRSIATAWEARAEETRTYNVGAGRNARYEELQRALKPTYIKEVPRTDGWGNPLRFTADGEHYSIRALAGDGRLDPTTITGATTDFTNDVLYADGTFVTYPEGI